MRINRLVEDNEYPMRIGVYRGALGVTRPMADHIIKFIYDHFTVELRKVSYAGYEPPPTPQKLTSNSYADIVTEQDLTRGDRVGDIWYDQIFIREDRAADIVRAIKDEVRKLKAKNISGVKSEIQTLKSMFSSRGSTGLRVSSLGVRDLGDSQYAVTGLPFSVQIWSPNSSCYTLGQTMPTDQWIIKIGSKTIGMGSDVSAIRRIAEAIIELQSAITG